MISGIKKTYLYSQVVLTYNKFNNLRKKIYNNFFSTAFILLYHRIDKVENDPHLLCVSPENFYQHLIFLKNHYQIISLKTLVSNLKKNEIDGDTVIITFDDGYADNFYNALPIIKKLSIPVTIFITADKINNQTPFYWDEDTPRKDQGRPLTTKELLELSKNSEIEIGSHTLIHPRLSQLSITEQLREIKESKKLLEKIIGKPVEGFSYPFGSEQDFTKRTVELVIRSNYHYACANISARVSNNSDFYKLPRYIVRNWTIEEFKKNFANFL